MKRNLTLVAAAAAGGLLLSACAASQATTSNSGSSNGGTATVAVQEAWSGFNAHTATQGDTTGIQIGSLIFPSAFNVEPGSKVVLNATLLSSATVTSQSPETIVYKVRPDAVWSDGSPISAADFIYLWHHMNGSDSTLSVTNNFAYFDIASVTGSDNGKTVTVVLRQPYAEWQSLFSQLLPAHYMASLGADPNAWDNGLTSKAPVSGGPFLITQNQPGATLHLKQNPKWYGPKPHLSGLVIEVNSDDESMVQAAQNGELDLADTKADATIINGMKAVAGMKFSLTPTLTQEQLGLNESHPLTGNPSVRLAIETAINVKTLLSTVYGSASSGFLVGNRFLQATAAGYQDNTPAGVWTGNAAAAAKILQAAGFTRSSGGYFAKNGQILSLIWAVSTGDNLGAELAQLIQGQLKAAGIKTTIATSPSTTYFTQILIPGTYDGLTFGYPGSAFPASWYSALYTCKGGYNFARFCDNSVDAAFDAASGTLSQTARDAMLNSIDKKLWQDAAPAPLFWVAEGYGVSSKLHGVVLPDVPENLFWNVTNWSLG